MPGMRPSWRRHLAGGFPAREAGTEPARRRCYENHFFDLVELLREGITLAGMYPKETASRPARDAVEKRFLKNALRFLRGAPQKCGNVKIIRGLRILLVNDFVDGGTRRLLRNFLRLHGYFLLAPGLPRL